MYFCVCKIIFSKNICNISGGSVKNPRFCLYICTEIYILYMFLDNKNTLFGDDSANIGNATSGVEQLSIFKNPNFGSLRVIIENGEPLFCLPDLCKVLDVNTSNISRKLDDWVLKLRPIEDAMGRLRDTNFVTEEGLYGVIFSSNKEEAKSFKRWIAGDVIPSIRKTGMYSLNGQSQTPSYMIEDPILRAKRWIEEKEYEMELERKNKIMAPKAEYFDDLVERSLLTNFRDTAKELHVKQNFFINYLIDNGYIYRDQRGKLKPIAEHVDSGLFEIKEYSNDKHSGVQTLITPKGRKMFNMLIKRVR